MASAYRWVVLGLAITAFLQSNLHRLAFPALIPAFIADLGLGYTAAGTVQSAYFWTYALVQVPIGVVADRWGARRVMVASMAVLAVGAVAFAATPNFAGGVLARMLVGLGAAAAWVPSLKLASEWFVSAERGRATGLVAAGGGLGGTLGLAVVPSLADRWGWRMGYALLALPALVTALLLALLLRRPASRIVAAHAPRGSLRRVLLAADLWPFNVAVCCSFGAYYSFLTFLPASLVRTAGLSPSAAGIVTALITAMTMVSWPLGGAISDRLGCRKPVYLTSQLLSLLAYAAFGLGVTGVGPVVTIAAALTTGLVVGGMILPFVMIGEIYPHGLVATAAGVANAACFVGAVILPIVLGRVVDAAGTFAPAFLVAAAAQAVTVVMVLFLRETGHRSIIGDGRAPA